MLIIPKAHRRHGFGTYQSCVSKMSAKFSFLTQRSLNRSS